MDCGQQISMLRKIQEMQFVAVELNLYLDTHPCDAEALNDFNCAVDILGQHKRVYEEIYGPLLNFGFGGHSEKPWQWVNDPWPWEL